MLYTETYVDAHEAWSMGVREVGRGLRELTRLAKPVHRREGKTREVIAVHRFSMIKAK